MLLAATYLFIDAFNNWDVCISHCYAQPSCFCLLQVHTKKTYKLCPGLDSIEAKTAQSRHGEKISFFQIHALVSKFCRWILGCLLLFACRKQIGVVHFKGIARVFMAAASIAVLFGAS